jgi:GAF domain-containing protein
MLNGAFDYFYWTGFYLVDLKKHNELVIGPYQGTLGCLRIPFGKGVCGLSAKTKKTFIVSDVHNFENHIVCDVNSQSEIVVPVFDKNSNLMAVLDVDSTELDAFDEFDRSGLENICSLLII